MTDMPSSILIEIMTEGGPALIRRDKITAVHQRSAARLVVQTSGKEFYVAEGETYEQLVVRVWGTDVFATKRASKSKETDLVSADMEMPRYKCHKEVHALQILKVGHGFNVVELHFIDARHAPIVVTKGWDDRYNPEALGYYVVSDYGHKSYSPREAFEEGYTEIK